MWFFNFLCGGLLRLRGQFRRWGSLPPENPERDRNGPKTGVRSAETVPSSRIRSFDIGFEQCDAPLWSRHPYAKWVLEIWQTTELDGSVEVEENINAITLAEISLPTHCCDSAAVPRPRCHTADSTFASVQRGAQLLISSSLPMPFGEYFRMERFYCPSRIHFEPPVRSRTWLRIASLNSLTRHEADASSAFVINDRIWPLRLPSCLCCVTTWR